jgi:hypothetical protein
MVVAFSIEAPMMKMQRDKGLAVASLAFVLCATRTASAQKDSSNRVGIEPRHSDSAQKDSSHRVGIEPRHSGRTLDPRFGISRTAADSLPAYSANGWKYPFYGALIGAGVGFTAAFIVTHQAHVKDHSEDALAYMVAIPFGTVAGFVAGFVLYAMRGH